MEFVNKLPCLVLALLSLSLGLMGDVSVFDLQENQTVVTFPDLQAGFGDDFADGGLEGYLVVADPPHACEDLKNLVPGEPNEYKWILLIARGGPGGDGCQFADKVLRAQERGYDAAIVHDNKQESAMPSMGGFNGTMVHIPSTFVGLDAGMLLGSHYNWTKMRFIIQIMEPDDFNYLLYLWPFAVAIMTSVFVIVFLVIKFARDHSRRQRSRLSTRHLKKIPVRKFKKGDYYDTCAICLDEYEDGEKIRVLPCDHVYHMKCIDPWLTKNKKTCPVCKRRVIPRTNADSEDSDSDGEAGGGSSERTPLLAGGSGRSREQPPPSTSINTAGAEIHVETEGAAGGVGISDVAQAPEVSTDVRVETSEANSDRRRRRKDRARHTSRTEATDEVDTTTGAALQRVAKELERQNKETKEERRERKKKKKESKRKRRNVNFEDDAPENTNQARRSESKSERRSLLDVEEDEFVSANSSFREVKDHEEVKKKSSRTLKGTKDEATDEATGSHQGVSEKGEGGNGSKKEVNPTFCEDSQEDVSIVNPVPIRREFNEIV